MMFLLLFAVASATVFSGGALDSDTYADLFTQAHLIDISYCISKFSRILYPFECGLHCHESFPNVSLVYQWYDDDLVCGYVATTSASLFHTEQATKKMVVSLRGTRSIPDTITDMKVDMTDYSNLHYHLPYCFGCKVHLGFYGYFLRLVGKVQEVVESEINNDYEIYVLGHSLGGLVGMLLALHFLDLGHHVRLVTMGQPLLGNLEFASWVDTVLGSHMLRVVHKDDIVTVLPRSRPLSEYAQFDSQVYVNCSAACTVPRPKQVYHCDSAQDPSCIAGDFGGLAGDYLESHNTYFRRLGLCPVIS